MHTEFIREDGETVEPEYNLAVATFYSRCLGIMNAEGYLRVICDAPGHYIETRVDHATLIRAGWASPDQRLLKAMGLLEDIADYFAADEKSAPNEWFRKIYELTGHHMILTEEGWESGEVVGGIERQNIVDGLPAREGIFDEVNRPDHSSNVERTHRQ